MDALFQTIHEDPDLLVINKPADLVCHPSKDGELSSLIGRIRMHLGEDARPHLVNRLDRETTVPALEAADEGLRREIGTAARETILRDYTWDHVAEKIMLMAAEGR